MCSYCFKVGSVTEWLPFEKQLLTRFTICSPCIFTICNICYFPFWFCGLDLVLIASVPVLCILFTFRGITAYCYGPSLRNLHM